MFKVDNWPCRLSSPVGENQGFQLCAAGMHIGPVHPADAASEQSGASSNISTYQFSENMISLEMGRCISYTSSAQLKVTQSTMN